MTEPHEVSYYDELRSNPRDRAELALASSMLRISELFDIAVRLRPEVTPAYLAEQCHVPVERVNDLIEGDERLSFEAFNRYVSLLGYAPVINLRRENASAPKVPIEYEEYVEDEVVHLQSLASDVTFSRWTKIPNGDGDDLTPPVEVAVTRRDVGWEQSYKPGRKLSPAPLATGAQR